MTFTATHQRFIKANEEYNTLFETYLNTIDGYERFEDLLDRLEIEIKKLYNQLIKFAN